MSIRHKKIYLWNDLNNASKVPLSWRWTKNARTLGRFRFKKKRMGNDDGIMMFCYYKNIINNQLYIPFCLRFEALLKGLCPIKSPFLFFFWTHVAIKLYLGPGLRYLIYKDFLVPNVDALTLLKVPDAFLLNVS